ncbi:MAG TPA: DEAD/DEAH box helicase family protein, partial [Nitrososphaerales archaeon]|nr:DEAD/DEAH box helicase family protein [Nitrososphaerales archaeon]
IAEFALSIKTTRLDKDALEPFFKKPYYLMAAPGRRDSWYLVVPKFVDVQIGYLERSTESYNVFLINRYTDWLGEVPEALRKQLGWTTPPELTLEGEDLVGSKGALETAWQKYRPMLSSRSEEGIHVNPKRAFELLATLIKDGVLPFSVKRVDKADLVDRKFDFELRDYQKQAWDALERYSNIGVYFPASTGKTVIGLYAMTHLKGPHLVVVPSRILEEQWTERIQTHTDLQPAEYAVMTYQMAIKKASKTDWTAMVIDECHHLPANYFAKLSFIHRKYTIGLSATPFREDGREEYIFALTGRPIGLSWDHFKKLGVIKSPTCHVWIVKNFESKVKQLESLLRSPKKTIIFSDSIEQGKMIASRFKLPHVWGETKARLATIQEAQTSVVSRVGDEGVSLPEIERVIEFNWLGGSRRQELQRFTRLLHGSEVEEEGEDHILMTLDEYLRDRKRLFSIMDKGFKIVLHREGVSEKVIEDRTESPGPRISLRTPRQRTPGPIEPAMKLSESFMAVQQRLPGITTTLAKLSSVESKVATTLLNNPGRPYDTAELALSTGLSANTLSNYAHFGKLEQMRLIKRVGKKYQSAL